MVSKKLAMITKPPAKGLLLNRNPTSQLYANCCERLIISNSIITIMLIAIVIQQHPNYQVFDEVRCDRACPQSRCTLLCHRKTLFMLTVEVQAIQSYRKDNTDRVHWNKFQHHKSAQRGTDLSNYEECPACQKATLWPTAVVDCDVVGCTWRFSNPA